MSAFSEERVLSVHHWTDRLFTFTTTRDPALRFSNGHFTMIVSPTWMCCSFEVSGPSSTLMLRNSRYSS